MHRFCTGGSTSIKKASSIIISLILDPVVRRLQEDHEMVQGTQVRNPRWWLPMKDEATK